MYGSVSSDSCYTILTTALPRYVCWLVESDVKHSEKAQVLLKEEEGTCLGTSLTTADTAHVFSNSLLSTPEEGKMSFFTEGILFLHPQYGTITLPRSLISRIKLYDLSFWISGQRLLTSYWRNSSSSTSWMGRIYYRQCPHPRYSQEEKMEKLWMTVRVPCKDPSPRG
nr:uncharacterized protein C20orf194 homolog [Oncorhynchus nerka]